MTTMMSAFEKMAARDSEMATLLKESKDLRIKMEARKKAIEEKEEAERLKRLSEEVRAEEERRKLLAKENLKLPMWKWVVKPEMYTRDIGIGFYESKDYAISALRKQYPTAIDIDVTPVDCSIPLVTLDHYYE